MLKIYKCIEKGENGNPVISYVFGAGSMKTYRSIGIFSKAAILPAKLNDIDPAIVRMEVLADAENAQQWEWPRRLEPLRRFADFLFFEQERLLDDKNG